ncbi:MAG: TIGR03960 family B12-binding radical SAM protein [Anaerolineae bacterium]|nr:TIGR03960 family B12-binding radical SAM protein [Anaerolineae bacterium]
MNTPEQIGQALEKILLRVERPGRYVGGEFNSVSKEWNSVQVRVALAFPDIYEIGMPNLGLAIFYDLINRRSDMLAERVYLPWTDMEAIMKQEAIPLFSLETKHPVAGFDLLALSVPYEQLYTNVLQLLHLAGLPLFSTARDETMPLVIAGGHATYNPEPLADFIDLFVIGEGEDAIIEIAEAVGEMKRADLSRTEQLIHLARFAGVYVPRFYEADYREDGTIAAVRPVHEVAQLPVLKRVVPVLSAPPTRFIVPNIDTVHNRAPIEIMRGCTRGCRFCHAGIVARPVRERSVGEIVDAVEDAVAQTGFEEVALLSLSSSDYTDVLSLVRLLGERFTGRHLSINLPSLRIETASVELMESLRDNKRGGFTFAPEAATERMRNIINKAMPHQQVLDVAHAVYSRGWRTIKLYFMIGHPSETLEDVKAIVDLSTAVLAEGRKIHGKKATVNIGVSTFIPKPHTPFQWVPMDGMEQIESKQTLLKRELGGKGKGIRLRWNDPEETLLEALLSRGDRRLGPVIHRAWQLGSKFDAWHELRRHEAWVQALSEQGLDFHHYTHRPRHMDEIFPWDHIDVVVKKEFLAEDYLMSQRGETRVDCRERCFACGILPKLAAMRSELPPEAWKCPPVSSRAHSGQSDKVSPASA